MNLEMIRALNELEKEKKIDKEIIITAIEEALESSYKKSSEGNQNVKVTIDRENGEVKVFALKNIVEEPKDPNTQISVIEAQKYGTGLNVGDVVQIEITPKNFGRSAAQKAKNVIVQKIREEERNIIYDEYYAYEKDIISGTIQRVDSNTGMIYIDLGKIEAMLTPQEQVPGEYYKSGDRIKAYVLEVKKTNRDPKIYVSRTHPGLVKRLFELEVAEIRQGFVEIKSISREAGFRTKIAVHSADEKIDPVGACVGQKGQRVQNVVDELKGEKIDIIKWSNFEDEYIASSLSPAKVLRVEINEEEKSAVVIVPDNQLSLAIGKEGQNVRLAAKLTGWKIDIKSETQLREYIESQLLNINNGEKGERYIEPEVVLNEEEAEDAAENIAEDETADVVEEAAQAQDKADEADDEAKEE